MVGPVFTKLRKDLSEHIRLGDGAIDVGDDDFVIPVPQVDGALTAAGALVLRGDAECDIIWPLLQLQAGDLVRGETERFLVEMSAGLTGALR